MCFDEGLSVILMGERALYDFLFSFFLSFSTMTIIDIFVSEKFVFGYVRRVESTDLHSVHVHTYLGRYDILLLLLV
jgi:hypothetical protein